MRTLYKISLLLTALSISPANASPIADVKSDPRAQEAEAAPVNMELKPGTVANYLAGQYARTTGDIETAIRYLRRAHQANPGNLDIIGQLQGLLLVNGNIEEAVQMAVNLPPGTPKNSLISLLLCLDAVKRGDNDRAATILDEAYETSNGQLWLPLVSSWVDLGRHQLQEPVKMTMASSEGSQTSALTQYHLALINAQAGFKDEAANNFRRAIVDVSSPPSRVMQMIGRFFGSNIPAPLAQAYASWRKENRAEAVIPEDIGPVFTLKDGIAEILFTMGNVVQGAGAPQEAVIYLHMAHYLKPEFTLVAVSLADAYNDLKQFDKANELFASIPEKSDLYMRAQLRIAINQNLIGDTEAALSQLDKISHALPKRFEATVAKGDLLRNHQRFDEAAQAYSMALSRIKSPDATHWPIFFARGVCLERQNKWVAAEADFKQALKLKPDQPDVLNYLGYGWLIREEHLDEAREMLEKAVSLRPNDPQIADSMGWALFKLAQYNEAAIYLEKALELLPSDPTINDHLGDAYWMLGRKTEARFQWERSLIYAPQREEAASIQKKLEVGLDTVSDNGTDPVVAEGRRSGNFRSLMQLPVTQAAPAKLNLYLHVTGKRADGFHLLESLVAFTALGDRLECYPDDVVSLDVRGPFAAKLPANAQNSVLRAAYALKERSGCRQGARMVLHKHVPIAAGLGGGSADAAAALRALVKLWNLAVSPQDLTSLAAPLGSDVKVCIASQPAIMCGIGDELTYVNLPADIWVVLINPLIEMPTAEVYSGFTSEYDLPSILPALDSGKALIGALSQRRNALTASAVARCPAIAEGLQALRDTNKCQLARMSGSGATCFGLYASSADAQQAALNLKLQLPEWWVEVTALA